MAPSFANRGCVNCSPSTLISSFFRSAEKRGLTGDKYPYPVFRRAPGLFSCTFSNIWDNLSRWFPDFALFFKIFSLRLYQFLYCFEDIIIFSEIKCHCQLGNYLAFAIKPVFLGFHNDTAFTKPEFRIHSYKTEKTREEHSHHKIISLVLVHPPTEFEPHGPNPFKTKRNKQNKAKWNKTKQNVPHTPTPHTTTPTPRAHTTWD